MGELVPFIAVTAVALAVVLWAEVAKRPLWNAVFKPVASAAFVAAGFAVGALEHPLGVLLVVALILGALGDVLLIPKEKKGVFIAGIGAFLLAHLAYGAMFLAMGVDLVRLLVALVFASAVAVLVWRHLAPHVTGAMRVAVMSYIAVITVMVALAFGVVSYGWLPVVAAVTFWLSDLTVARHRFVRQAAVNRLVGLPLYYAAQYLFIGLVV
ncbi:MAG TPA: lysoplasmalogenase [Myxococcota bacterium]|nr:lysoplasmalogenase [Myxococcota bacterium]